MMANGIGKTVFVAMVIAWQILGKTAYRNDPRFAMKARVAAPGLTAKNPLAVLKPTLPENYYKTYVIVPYFC